MNIAIVMDGVAPVPATRGGAVETLVEHLLEGNEIEKFHNITVISIFDQKAKDVSTKYKNTNFIYIKPSKFSFKIDNFVYCFFKDIIKVKSNMKFRNIIKRYDYINKVSKYLLENNFDKIILQNHTTLYLALKNKNYEKYKDKYYLHLHNEIKSDYGCRDIILNTRKILCISNFISNSTEKFLDKYDKKNLEVLYNVVDINKFDKESLKKERYKIRNSYDVRNDEILVVFSGRLTAEKGILELLKAFNIIKSEKIKLLIVGSFFYDSDMASSQDKEINELSKNIREKIIFTGYVKQKEMPNIYAAADIAVLPSMWEEPAGLTVIESMASSLPIITTYSGGIPEYVNDKCAFLLKRDNDIVKNIADKIELLANDTELRENMGKCARVNSKKFNSKEYYRKFCELIKG